METCAYTSLIDSLAFYRKSEGILSAKQVFPFLICFVDLFSQVYSVAHSPSNGFGPYGILSGGHKKHCRVFSSSFHGYLTSLIAKGQERREFEIYFELEPLRCFPWYCPILSVGRMSWSENWQEDFNQTASSYSRKQQFVSTQALNTEIVVLSIVEEHYTAGKVTQLQGLGSKYYSVIPRILVLIVLISYLVNSC